MKREEKILVLFYICSIHIQASVQKKNYLAEVTLASSILSNIINNTIIIIIIIFYYNIIII